MTAVILVPQRQRERPELAQGATSLIVEAEA